MKTIKRKNHIVKIKTRTSNVTAEWQQLDRETCERMIASIPDIQRIPKRSNMQKIRHDIENGKWKLTGEPIIISDIGAMIDGQHRVMAFLETDYYPEVLVVRGVEHKGGYKAIDVGVPRSMADVFKAHEIPNYSTAASTTIGFMKIRNKDPRGHLTSYSSQELLSCYHANEEKLRFWMFKNKNLNNVISAVTRASISAYAEDSVGRDVMADFWDQVETGIGSGGAGSLRKALVQNVNKTRGKYKFAEFLFITLTAIKMHVTNAGQRQLKVGSNFPYFN